jgi:ribose/xylose/arabinose/galactoside ABC-type transport system permease subunit
MVLISLIDDGLVLVNADPFWVQFLIGALILGAVVVGRTRLSSMVAFVLGARRASNRELSR